LREQLHGKRGGQSVRRPPHLRRDLLVERLHVQRAGQPVPGGMRCARSRRFGNLRALSPGRSPRRRLPGGRTLLSESRVPHACQHVRQRLRPIGRGPTGERDVPHPRALCAALSDRACTCLRS
jgi:hypothetical protein